jgi:hypothetical protein
MGISFHRCPAGEPGRGIIYQELWEMDEGGSRNGASLLEEAQYRRPLGRASWQGTLEDIVTNSSSSRQCNNPQGSWHHGLRTFSCKEIEYSRVPLASRRINATDLNYRERHEWHMRPMFSRRTFILLLTCKTAWGIAVCEYWQQSEGRLRVFNGTAKCHASGGVYLWSTASRLSSGLWVWIACCMSTELSVEGGTWNSGELFCVHYCLNCSNCSVNKHC